MSSLDFGFAIESYYSTIDFSCSFWESVNWSDARISGDGTAVLAPQGPPPPLRADQATPPRLNVNTTAAEIRILRVMFMTVILLFWV
jgi:hypothetical protein